MPEPQVTPPVVAPPAEPPVSTQNPIVETAPGRKTAADYAAAALKAIEEHEAAEPKDESAPPAPTAPKARTPEQEAAALEKAALEPEAPASEEKPKEEPPKDEPKGFDELVRKNAALRMRETALRQKEMQVDKLSHAISAKDPLALLAAAGFAYKDVVQQVINGDMKDKKAAAAPEASAYESRLAKLEAELQQERATRTESQMVAKAAELARDGGEKFKFTTGRKAEKMAIAYLQEYHRQTGEFPADNLDASLKISLEAVEADLRKEAASWKALLTEKESPVTQPGAGSNPPKDAASRPQGTQAPKSKTLTNSQAAAAKSAAPKPSPRTSEDYQRLALEMIEKESAA